MQEVKKSTNIYTALASVYDKVMEEVNYELWADFIDEIMQTHHPDPYDILELGCGTGSLTLSLDELMCYKIYATDNSPEMIEVARSKARNMITSQVSFGRLDFLDLTPLHPQKFDVVLLTFDSINYLRRENEVLRLFNQVKHTLRPKGIFIFDFTTPQNSEQAITSLDGEEGFCENFYYHRNSHYDTEERIHTNTFTIQQLDEQRSQVVQTFREEHKQRIYSLREIQRLVDRSELKILSQYEGFDLVEADHDSLRVTMTLQCPQTP